MIKNESLEREYTQEYNPTTGRSAEDIYYAAIEESDSNNGKKSAVVESGWDIFVHEFNDCTHHTITLSDSCIPAQKDILNLIKALTSKKPPKNISQREIGIKIQRVDNISGTTKTEGITVARMSELWENSKFTLNRVWATPVDFIIHLSKIVIAYRQSVNRHRQERVEHQDAVSDLLRGTTVMHETVSLGDACIPPDSFTEDTHFLYDFLRTRCGELYWCESNGIITPIYKDDRTYAIHQSSEFLNRWEYTHYELLKNYRQIILDYAQYTMDDTSKNDSGFMTTLTERLLPYIPRMVLENTKISLRYKVMDGKKMKDGIDVGTGKGDLATNWSLSTWRDIFMKSALRYVQRNRIRQIKLFSNMRGEGVVYYPLDGIHTQGVAYDARPNLPPNWSRFLFGDDGKKPIFACDTEMSLLRLAYFISQLVKDTGYTRQMLVIAGKGDDGKSVFNNVMREIIGASNFFPTSPDSLASDGHLQGIVNKVLISLPELQKPSNIFNNTVLKQITGRDTMSIRQLYCMPFSYTPDHVFVMATTNKKTYAKGNYAITRLLPVVFQQNYDTKTQISDKHLVEMLISEKTEFLQWCFDMVRYYRDKKNAAGESTLMFKPNGLTIMTDSQYATWLCKTTPMTDTEISRSKKLEQLTIVEAINNCCGRFEAMLDEDAEENDAELFNTILKKYFIIEKGAVLTKVQLQMFIMENAVHSLFKVCGFNANNLQYCPRYRCFLNYIRALDGIEETTLRIDKIKTRCFTGLKLIDSDQANETPSYDFSTMF